MKVGGIPYRAIFTEGEGADVQVIDQTLLPHRFRIRRLRSAADAAHAISAMVVRGAPLIGATAAYGIALAMRADPSDASLRASVGRLMATRPTAVNLRWALENAEAALRPLSPASRTRAAYGFAHALCEDDVRINRSIGDIGLDIFREIHRPRKVGRACPAGP